MTETASLNNIQPEQGLGYRWPAWHATLANYRDPDFRLKECYDAVPALQARPHLTLKQSLSAIRLKVWDEERRTLIGFGALT